MTCALAIVLVALLAPSTQTAPGGPDVVILKELQAQYEPVPFDHRSHASMAQMAGGCTTCHHRPPNPTTQPAIVENMVRSQDESAEVPACRSCHALDEEHASIQMPSLKGAYHRQCLNCHREWAHENACGACHKPLESPATALSAATAPATMPTKLPSPDDIVGRMHPPISAPTEKVYVTRFMPAAGPNVIFRHDQHARRFGVRCAGCHHQDTCAHCHDPNNSNGAAANGAAANGRANGVASDGGAPNSPLRPGRSWRDTHGPCISCHLEDRCASCHYKDDQPPPPPFEHAFTGQSLDADHAGLRCVECHAQLKAAADPTCGGASCHASRPGISFPADRPGPIVATTRPARGIAQAAQQHEITADAATQPATQPLMIRIRRR